MSIWPQGAHLQEEKGMKEREEYEKRIYLCRGKQGCQCTLPETACVASSQWKARGPRRRPVSPRLRASPCWAQHHISDGLQSTFPAARAWCILQHWQRRCQRSWSSLELHPQKGPLSAVDRRGWCQDLKALLHLEKLEEKIMPFCLFYCCDLSKDLCCSFFCPTYLLSTPCFFFTGATDHRSVSPLASPFSPISGPWLCLSEIAVTGFAGFPAWWIRAHGVPAADCLPGSDLKPENGGDATWSGKDGKLYAKQKLSVSSCKVCWDKASPR